MKKTIIFLMVVAIFSSCDKEEIIVNNDVTVAIISSLVNETRSTGEIVEKPIDSFISLYLLPAGVTAKEVQSISDLVDGYVVDTNGKSHDRTYIYREKTGQLIEAINPGNYFVLIMTFDKGKYSYTTVFFQEHITTEIKKVFDSEHPIGCFEIW